MGLGVARVIVLMSLNQINADESFLSFCFKLFFYMTVLYCPGNLSTKPSGMVNDHKVYVFR